MSELENSQTRNVRLGVLLRNSDLPCEQERSRFLSRFGHQHCFLVKSWIRGFRVFSSSGVERLPFDALGVDYLYAPDTWERRITNDQIRNALLSLRHSPNDVLIVSASLSQFPLVEVSSIRNHTIFSKKLGLDFPLGQSATGATGKILRLLPYDQAVRELNVEDVFRAHSMRWAPEPCWPPHNRSARATHRITSSDQVATSFIPKFRKQKPMVFVWSIFMMVGGAERTAIQVMRHLKDKYHFVVITSERSHKSQGSLHHQLKDIAETVYDLGELAPYEKYLEMLSDLKETYQPDLIWTTNGSPWFSDNAMQFRELFKDIPVVDQQVYDTSHGWILRYRERGIQSFDRFVAINRRIHEVFIDGFRMDPDRVDLIYHAVDTDRFDPFRYSDTERRGFFKKFGLNEDQKSFVFAGRLTSQKRPMDFLELARRRQQAGDDAFFAMVGDGELTPVVDDFIRAHELKNVRRIPFVENMAEVFSIASGLILTSEFEGMPIVILEALCMGVPILATDVGDVKLMLDAYQAGAVISEIGDIDAIERNYEAWLADLDNYRKNAQANAETIRDRFSGEAVSRQYAESWERARQEHKSASRRPSGAVPDLVSVIIPSYNHALYLRSAIDSVLNQSYRQIELIVIEDGSTDDSVNCLQQIKDPRFSFCCQENRGAHEAINLGLNLASGEFLAILNSDDEFHPNRIERLLTEFRNDPEIELLSTWIEVIDANGQQLAIKEGWHNCEPWPIEHPKLSFQKTEDFGLNLLMGNFVASTSNIFMRRSLYDQVGGMRNLQFTHDWDFLLRAAARAKCKLIPEPLVKYRVHEANTISSDRAGMLFEICWVLAANFHRFEGARIFNGSDPGTSIEDLVTLYESINFQGNDKVFWVMKAFIESMRSKGMVDPEELVLENNHLRERLIGYIRP